MCVYVYIIFFSIVVEWFVESRCRHLDGCRGNNCRITYSLWNKAWITTIAFILDLFILHYIIILYYIVLYYIILHILRFFYHLFTSYLKVAMVGLNWRGLDSGNWTILGEERLLREAYGGGGNTIQGLLSSVYIFFDVMLMSRIVGIRSCLEYYLYT